MSFRSDSEVAAVPCSDDAAERRRVHLGPACSSGTVAPEFPFPCSFLRLHMCWSHSWYCVHRLGWRAAIWQRAHVTYPRNWRDGSLSSDLHGGRVVPAHGPLVAAPRGDRWRPHQGDDRLRFNWRCREKRGRQEVSDHCFDRPRVHGPYLVAFWPVLRAVNVGRTTVEFEQLRTAFKLHSAPQS
jgi:hypothetical protein